MKSECSAEGYLWNKLYKREVLSGLCFDESLSMSEDMLFVFQAIEHVNALAVTDEPLYYYRKNTESATGYFNMTADKCKQGIDVAIRIADIVGNAEQKNVIGYKDFIAVNYYRYCVYLAERQPEGWKSEMQFNRAEYLKYYDAERVEKSHNDESIFVTNYTKWLTNRYISRKKMQIKRILKRL